MSQIDFRKLFSDLYKTIDGIFDSVAEAKFTNDSNHKDSLTFFHL
jgi:hypothetical protein